jgi:hypothetical protein
VIITICPHLTDYALERAPRRERVILIENTLFEEIRLANHTGSEDRPDIGQAKEASASCFQRDAGRALKQFWIRLAGHAR